MKSLAFQISAIGALVSPPATAWAHANHVLSGSHWHATDSWGFAAFGAALALAIWLSQAGKP